MRPLAIACAAMVLLAGCGRPAHPPSAATRPVEPPVPVLHLPKVAGWPAELTARIDEGPWRQVPELPAMTLVGTVDGKPACATRVKACWDGQAIRIIWHCQDDAVVAQHRHRDDPLYMDDVVEVFLDPEGDLKRYHEFVFNANGALFDAAIDNPTIKRGDTFRFDRSWTCQGIRWKAVGQGRFNGMAADDRWWAVEAEIPFAGLGRTPPAAGETWRAGVFRIDNTVPVQWHSWSAMVERKYGLHQSDRFGLWIFDE